MLTRSQALEQRRKKKEDETQKTTVREDVDIEQVDVRHSPVNEQIVLAAAAASDEARAYLCRQITTSSPFQFEVHAAAWDAFLELQRKGLLFDIGTFQSVCPNEQAVALMQTLVQTRPNPLSDANLAHHVDRLNWDHVRHTASTGPISQLLEAVASPLEDPAKVQALARSVVSTFEHYGNRSHILDGRQLARQVIDEHKAKRNGENYYRFGIDGLDFDEKGHRRLVSGCSPSNVIVVTGVSGGAKSTVTMNIVLAQAKMKRKCVYGAWEISGKETLALLAAFSLGYSRTRLEQGELDESELERLEEEMLSLTKYVTFVTNPFFAGGARSLRKRTNDDNLDIVEQIIADTGADVFIADLWKRCLRQTDPDDEELALIRQQAMAEQYKCCCILVQQQRMKDVEMRPDKRPTREGIKGSSAWVDVADLILAPNRPAQWKRIPDDKIELIVLKQRRGPWPLAVECDWDGEYGSIKGARTIDYERPGETSDDFSAKKGAGKLSAKMRGGK